MLQLIRVFLCLIVFCLVFSCKNKWKTEISPIPATDTLIKTIQDTPEVKPDETEEISLNTPNRVAWQKPRIIIDLFGKDLSKKTIADIGAGPTGFFTYELADKGATVLAIDIDHNALSYIESNKTRLDSTKRSKVHTRLARPEDPNLETNEIDGILIVNTITYIQNKLKYLQSLHDKLKEGGRLVLVDFKMKRLPEQIAPPKSERIYEDKLEDILYQAGYKNIRIDDQTLNFQYIITADK